VLAFLGIHVHVRHSWPALLAAVPAGLLLIAAAQAWLSARSERRRTQPVVICHEHRSRAFSSEPEGTWVAHVWLSNEGGGNAFNVSFGIRMRDSRIPWRGQVSSAELFAVLRPRLTGAPSRIRVIRSGERVPDRSPNAIALHMASIEIWTIAMPRRLRRRRGTIDDGRAYWCRYENAHGQTWETLNPADPTRDLRIRRVYFRRLRERFERRHLRRLRERGLPFETEARRDLDEAKAAAHARLQARAQALASGGQPPEEDGGQAP
jgi:hypothetical protein